MQPRKMIPDSVWARRDAAVREHLMHLGWLQWPAGVRHGIQDLLAG